VNVNSCATTCIVHVVWHMWMELVNNIPSVCNVNHYQNSKGTWSSYP